MRIPIAILDQNADFLRLLTYVLRERDSEEIEIIAASSDMNTLLAQTTQAPAVALIGLSVPNLVDEHMISQLRVHWPYVGILVLSSLEQAEYYQQALASGADAVISKLQLATELLPAIQKLYNLPSREQNDGNIASDQG
ncbi:hypothetical protein SE17_32465 [Kouleothrix aurantiaca]|uniref:Response regulatory domain-containing protein n=1 Tax=Kouleothrix aurantiaca TaxID=186479 RepID=A0A0P9FAA0_9CHLR|nr:hypothetical protein SE17_32465 [Kouleothrix aurantiaca]